MALTPHMVTVDCADPHKLAAFWTAAAGYELEADHGTFLVLCPASGEGLRMGLQQVSEPRVGKNRVHIDFVVADRLAEVGRLVTLGATVQDEHVVPGFSWTVLSDPDGNEFCVAGHG